MIDEKRVLTREEFLKKAGKFAAGAVVGGSLLGLVGCSKPAAEPPKNEPPAPAAPPEPPAWPWPYKTLDVNAAAKGGYDGYMVSDCCYGAFHSLIAELRKEVGFPYDYMPTDMFRFGAGGVAGWSTLCGALIGACAVIQLVVDEKDGAKVINELMGWYTEAAFPVFKPEQPKKSDKEIVQSVSGSPLCHVSVTKWCEASGYKATSAERSERCGRLTADVTKKAAELLNDYHAGKFAVQYVAPASVTGCMSCHGKDGMDDTRGKMDCVQCHPTAHK